MFVDTAAIRVFSGKGGDGKISFHREKYVAAGGPDGGDGGDGGSVVFVVDDHCSTLLDFKYKKNYRAQDGAPGEGKNKAGKSGEDVVIKVPRGTLIKDRQTGLVIKDMSQDEPFTALKGGRGGWGNARFATPTRQAPRFARPGQAGTSMELVLELKLIADVGLIGMPNAGKSTLLSMISAARPKIANYPFTTLVPNLGVVSPYPGETFVCADIPGLIEGAAEGTGLGHDFLRHVERCRLLIHMVDAAGTDGRDPVDDLRVINNELEAFSERLSKLPQIVVANKLDAVEEGSDVVERLRSEAEKLGSAFIAISAASNENVRKLVEITWDMLKDLPPVIIYQPEYIPEKESRGEREIIIEERDGVYYVTGSWPEKAVASVNFEDYESRMYFDKILRNAGVFEMLEERGIEEGDTVDVCGMQFDYIP